MEPSLHHHRWAIFFAFIILISILGLFFPELPDQWGDAKGINAADVAWMISASGLVMLMTPGLSFFYGGMVRAKNVISTMLQSFIALGVVTVIWYVVGFSLCFGDSLGGIIGDPRTYFMFQGVGSAPHPQLGATIPFALFALFQLKFAILTPALITGSFAERVHFSGYMLFMVLFSLIIYAPLAHMTWHPDGLLNVWGIKDFAGGLVVHASSGAAALAGAIFFGRRKSKKHQPANIPFVLLGAGLLWFGWFGFNGGSSLRADALAVRAFMMTGVASGIAMLAWVFFDCVRGRKPSAIGAGVGAVVGLVAITPSAGWVTTGQSLFIGCFTSIICNIAVYWKDHSSIDDALDVFPTHGIGGVIGTIFTGVFVGGLVAGNVDVFAKHVIAVTGVCLFSFFGSWILYYLTNKMIPLRVSSESEDIGLDESQHSEKYL
ncbi:MAG: ammonium transporter [Planctomycetia bacterium]|nr:ammonium transporter [Planctomycetia bacterium]